MNLVCPYCRSNIPLQDVNVSTDIALCRNCGKTLSVSEDLASSRKVGPDLNVPPRGAWFQQQPQGFRIGASTRSWTALFLIPFTCVWAGGSLSGLYGSQFRKGHFDPTASLFGMPFLLGSCVLIAMCAMTLAGKVEITRIDDRLSIFTGIGPIGWSRRFLWSDFSLVREERGGWASNRGHGQIIVLEGVRRAALGSMLSEERRYFVFYAIRKMLRDQTMSSTR
jgi:hypothetical protein